MTDTPAMPDTAPDATTHRFQAEVEQVLRLVVHSLYSNPEIFLRELLSNASDALDKLRFRSVTEPSLAPPGELKIRIEPDATSKTLTISDDGVGMTRDELVSHLGTIARSGSRELLEKLKAAGTSGDVSLIGQFGVGFYSAFLVADHVDVVSRAAGSSEAWRWSSDAKTSFTIEPATRETSGTSVTLHLNPEHVELLRAWKLEQLVRQYSDYLAWPIELKLEREKDEGAPAEWRRINRGVALWQRSASEVTKEQYVELYQHLAHAHDEPLAWKHFRVEGTQEFTGLLYVPGRAPFDLFSPEPRHGLRLHVKRVFVMEDCDEVLPRWLRFVRGVVDSEDLPLNVSREILQDSRLVRVIRKQVVKQTLDALTELAVERPGDYRRFWRTFGAVLKEGLHYEPDQASRLAPLLRFESSFVASDAAAVEEGPALSSLVEYTKRMPEGQNAIYYALGESRRQIEASPQLEGLRARGFEILYLVDSVDAFAITSLPEFEGKSLVSASAANLDLADDAAKPTPEAEGALDALKARARVRLQEHVSEVRLSTRLTGSPACLVIPEGGLAPHLERILRATQGNEMPVQKRVLELNGTHELITSLASLAEKHPERPELDAWIDLVYDQARIAEGSPIEDPARFAASLTSLLTEAAKRAAS